jgi:hypothetical protein
MSVAALSLAVVVAGCGGHMQRNVTGQVGLRRNAHVAEVRGSVVAIYNAFTHANGRRFCALLTDDLRAALLDLIRNDGISAGERNCGDAVMHYFTAHNPPGGSPAMNDVGRIAGDYGFRQVAIRGSSAVVRFPSGRRWRLRRVQGRWLVDAFPLLSESNGAAPTTLT